MPTKNMNKNLSLKQKGAKRNVNIVLLISGKIIEKINANQNKTLTFLVKSLVCLDHTILIFENVFELGMAILLEIDTRVLG